MKLTKEQLLELKKDCKLEIQNDENDTVIRLYVTPDLSVVSIECNGEEFSMEEVMKQVKEKGIVSVNYAREETYECPDCHHILNFKYDYCPFCSKSIEWKK